MIKICDKCGECYIESENSIIHECRPMNAITEGQQEQERQTHLEYLTGFLNIVNIRIIKDTERNNLKSIKELQQVRSKVIEMINEF